MTPTALSIISTTFPEGAERNKALGIWGALGGIGATAAWLIGGPLVDGPGWEWIFFINIPLGLGALVLSPLLLGESRAALTLRSYDPAGLASGLSNTALQIGAALGVAIVSTVGVSRSGDYLAANEGANPLVVLTAGFQSGFVACVVLAGIGAALALLLPGWPGKAAQQQLEPVPATGAAD